MKRLIARALRVASHAAGYAVLRTRNRYSHDGLFTMHSDHFRRAQAFRAAYARGVQPARGSIHKWNGEFTFSGPVLSQYSQQEIDRGRDATAKSALAAGACVTDLERVRANFSEWPNAPVVQGAVPDVLVTLNFKDGHFCTWI